jgi:hypothetical protein
LVSLTRSEQRWLNTVLRAIRSIELATEDEVTSPPPPPPAARPQAQPQAQPQAREEDEPKEEPREGTFSVALEGLLNGDVTLDECLRQYPDLADELRAVSEVAELLRGTGQSYRRLGEEVLKGLDQDGDWPEDKDKDKDKDEDESPD